MSVAILLSGTIFKEPTRRTSQSGRPYVTTTLKTAAADNSTSDFWSVLAFGTTVGDELLRLAVGERCTIQGGLKLELYTASDGKQKISRTVFTDHVMALRQPPKERRAKPARGAPASQEQSTSTSTDPPFDDSIPF
jgi:single-stranded DNA-binding protein